MPGQQIGVIPEEVLGIAHPAPVVAIVPPVAAGVDWSFIPSGATLAKVRAVVATLATSSVVAARYPVIELTNPDGDILAIAPGPATQAASLTGVDCWAIGQDLVAVLVNFQATSLPDIWLPPGAKVKTSTVALQVADQWSAMTVTYDLWPYVPRG